MEAYTNFASCNMTLNDIDQAEIDEMFQQIQWEQTFGPQFLAGPEDHATNLDPTFSPLSGYASPSSMTTGSTNQSPLVPFLDYDMSFPMAPAMEDPESLFPELMDYSIDMNPDCAGSTPEGYNAPFFTSDDAQAKTTSHYPLDGHHYPNKALDTTAYNNTPTVSTYATTQPPSIADPPPQPTTTTTTPSSSSQPAATNNLACSHCGATFTDRTKLKVHTNKHTKPFRCTAAGCDYATAEKKSLQRHLLAKSKWDEEHRAAAQSEGVRQVKHCCPRGGCTYATVREDNLKRHMNTCAQ